MLTYLGAALYISRLGGLAVNKNEFIIDVRFVPRDEDNTLHVYASITHIPTKDYISKSWHGIDYLTGAGLAYAWFLAVMGGADADVRTKTDKLGNSYRQHPLW